MVDKSSRPILSLSLAAPPLPSSSSLGYSGGSSDMSRHSGGSSAGSSLGRGGVGAHGNNTKRIPSWGSGSVSLAGMEMEGLPSPVSSMSGDGQNRHWSGFGALGQQGSSDQAVGGWGSWGTAEEGATSSGSANSEYRHSSPARARVPEVEAPPASKSKTNSFFDSDQQVLSPPPNPLSRAGSLRETYAPREHEASPGSWLHRDDDPDRPPVALARRSTVGSTRPLKPPPSRLPPRLPAFADFSVDSPPTPSFPDFSSHLTPLSTPAHLDSSIADSPLAGYPTPRDAGHRGARFLDFGQPSARAAPPSPAVTAAPPADTLSSLLTIEDPPLKEGEFVGDYVVVKPLGKGAFSKVALARKSTLQRQRTSSGDDDGVLVALKMISKKSYAGNERMKISVLREVEVLKHIHHSSLVSLSSSFTTPMHTVLVLDYAPGGELFDFLANWHTSLSEAMARRLFGELCAAVGWMHSIGLVHRDIKLENILLMSRPFPNSLSPPELLSSLPTPFLKLTDFGLSRFISPTSPLLSTRCGSEAYAAPELIMGKQYDGRQTDTWALGVVLFAIITGEMPFIEAQGEGKRRAYLMKVAKGQYTWPDSATSAGRLVTPDLRALVERLLVRDPSKRARVDEIWDSAWMQGEGRPERTTGWVSPRVEGETGSVEGSWFRRDEEE